MRVIWGGKERSAVISARAGVTLECAPWRRSGAASAKFLRRFGNVWTHASATFSRTSCRHSRASGNPF